MDTNIETASKVRRVCASHFEWGRWRRFIEVLGYHWYLQRLLVAPGAPVALGRLGTHSPVCAVQAWQARQARQGIAEYMQTGAVCPL